MSRAGKRSLCVLSRSRSPARSVWTLPCDPADAVLTCSCRGIHSFHVATRVTHVPCCRQSRESFHMSRTVEALWKAGKLPHMSLPPTPIDSMAYISGFGMGRSPRSRSPADSFLKGGPSNIAHTPEHHAGLISSVCLCISMCLSVCLSVCVCDSVCICLMQSVYGRISGRGPSCFTLGSHRSDLLHKADLWTGGHASETHSRNGRWRGNVGLRMRGRDYRGKPPRRPLWSGICAEAGCVSHFQQHYCALLLGKTTHRTPFALGGVSETVC